MNNGKTAARIAPHPFYIAKLMYPYLTLLIIPVFKGLADYIRRRQNDLPDFFAAELVMLTVIAAVSYLKLKRVKITVSDGISVSKGLFCKVRYVIPRGAAKLTVVESNPFLRPFGIYRLKLYTEAGRRNKPDEDLPIRKRDAVKLCGAFDGDVKPVKRGAPFNNIFMAAVSSSVSAGLLIAIPVVKLAASLLGRSVSSLLPEIAEAAVFPFDIPKIGRYLSAALFVGYAASFTVIVLRYSGFTSVSGQSGIKLCSGVFPHRALSFGQASVTAVKKESPFVMRLAGRCVVRFSSCGYGGSNNEPAVLIPCVKTGTAERTIGELLPGLSGAGGGIRPRPRAVGRCFLMPALIAFAISFGGGTAALKFSVFGLFFKWVTAIMLVIDAAYAAVRIDELIGGRLMIGKDRIYARSRKRFTAVGITAKASNVESVCIIKTPFDLISGLCRVKIRIFNKSRDSISLRYLDGKQAEKMIKRPERT